MDLTKTLGGGTLVPPGSANIGTVNQWMPLNATDRPNNLAGVALGNGVASLPTVLNEGLQKSLSQLLIMADGFLPAIGALGDAGYRQVFDKHTIPYGAGSMAKAFKRAGRMDESPFTAPLTGLTGWNPTMNETTIAASQCVVTANAYGRYFKFHRFTDLLSSIQYKVEVASQFVMNANNTMNNLAGIRMFEGANKMYVTSIAAYDPTDPYAPRITLGANASTVGAPLAWATLLEARHLMENHKEFYTTIDPGTGTQKDDNERKSPIPGYKNSSAYLVLLGHNGYNQITADPRFRDTFVINGGISAINILNEDLGVANPILGLMFQKINNPLTIAKKTTTEISTDGNLPLEVAFVIGGGISPVGIELSLEGETRVIDIGYNDSAKLDPFSLLSITGWMTVTDFSIIQNEALYAIPYDKFASAIATGSVVKPPTPFLK